MDVLMLNTYDDVGGASRAATRLRAGLEDLGVGCRLLVQFKASEDDRVLCRAGALGTGLRRLKLYLGLLPVHGYPNRPENNFSPALLPDRLPGAVARLAPDLIHLHWLGAGFCRIESIARFGRPLVWTLHDSWPFTGGCHVPGSCRKYRERCGACPVLGSSRESDLSRWTWRRKERAWRNLPLTVVAPSRWAAECARASSLLGGCRVEVIPNGLDTERFRPLDKGTCRERLGLPRDRPVVLFGAVNALRDPNKGWHLLQSALRRVAERLPAATAAVFGVTAPREAPALGLPVAYLGHLDEPKLVEAYSAADVFAAPSAQETFCQTAAEAMACGTPVVAFGATGLLDVVDHERDGYLAEPYQAEDLARGIVWVLEDPERSAALANRARRKTVDAFDVAAVAERHASLYRELLASPATERRR